MTIIIWLLGVADVYLTKLGLELGVISEGNPVMAYLFSYNPNTAILFSVAVSGFFLYCLHRLQGRSTLAGKALWGLLFIRIFVMMLHANWLIRFSLPY